MKEQTKNVLIIFVVVAILLGAVYFATAYKTGEISHKTTSTEESTNNDPTYDNMIIASRTFDIESAEYMVLFYSNKDASKDLQSVISSYDSSEKSTKLYKVNTDEAINKYVLAKENNESPATASDLKMMGTTLIIIKDGKVSSYISNEDNIISTLE